MLKVCLKGFSESIAHELELFEIKVIFVEPWVIKTNLEIKLGRVSSIHSDNANSHIER